MFDSFLTFINQPGLDLAERRTLLTVSGGIDSIVMLNLFYKAGLAAGVAHCNFGLRGEESVLDELFVRQLAERYGFPVHVKSFDTKSYAKEKSISTQMAARDLRYEWFESIRNEYSYDLVATAHHSGDALETALLNLARGTGIAGLHGIAFQNKCLIRPILFATKEEIAHYANLNKLVWREDRSNNSLDYKRNLIRHRIIPVMKELNPSVENTFKITSERLSAADALLSEYLNHWKREVMKQVGDELHISIEALKSTSETTYRLWFILKDYAFSYIQTIQISKALNSLSGKLFYSVSHILLKDRTILILRGINEEEDEIPSIVLNKEAQRVDLGDYSLFFETLENSASLEIVKSGNAIFLDEAKLRFPLSVRNWLSGDIFCPFGMNGKRKKVSDLLVDAKLNLFAKKEIKVLVNGDGNLLWVIGIRADDRYRIAPETEHIVKISVMEKLLN